MEDEPVESMVTLESCGTSPVRITRIEVVEAARPSDIEDFEFDLSDCESTERKINCRLDVDLCAATEPDCESGGEFPGVSLDIRFRYQNLLQIEAPDAVNLIAYFESDNADDRVAIMISSYSDP